MNETVLITALIFILIIVIASSFFGWRKRVSEWLFNWLEKTIPGWMIEPFLPSEDYVFWIALIVGFVVGDWVGYSLIPRLPRQGIGELAFVLRFYISLVVCVFVGILGVPILNIIPRIIEKFTPVEDPTGLKCPVCGRPKAAKSSKCLKCGYQF